MTEFKQVEEERDLIRDMHSKAIINTNKSAYLAAVQRKKTFEAQKDSLRDATREINILKSEMHEIKSLLVKLVDSMIQKIEVVLWSKVHQLNRLILKHQ